jgi:hypothetical protein
MEHVQEVLVEMRDHMLRMSQKPTDPTWNGIFEHNFKQMLEAHKDKYRMASQTVTHLAVAGGRSNRTHDRPAIELF